MFQIRTFYSTVLFKCHYYINKSVIDAVLISLIHTVMWFTIYGMIKYNIIPSFIFFCATIFQASLLSFPNQKVILSSATTKSNFDTSSLLVIDGVRYVPDENWIVCQQLKQWPPSLAFLVLILSLFELTYYQYEVVK